MKKNLFRAKRSNFDEIVVGQLLWIGKRPHIIRDCDIEEDGHHFVQSSDLPTWVDESTIEPVINEEELDRFAKDFARIGHNQYDNTAYTSFKAGYLKAKQG